MGKLTRYFRTKGYIHKIKSFIDRIKPGKSRWKGAAIGSLIMGVSLWISMASSVKSPATPFSVMVILLISGPILAAIVGALTVFFNATIKVVPLFYRWALFFNIAILAIFGIMRSIPAIIIMILIGIILVAVCSSRSDLPVGGIGPSSRRSG